MISFRQIVVIALAIAIIWLIGRLRRRFSNIMTTHASENAPTSSKQAYTDTVRCNHCGVYLLRAEASGNDQQGYSCNDKHCIAKRQ